MSYLDKVFIWLGNINSTQIEFEDYFKLDYSVEGDFDNPKYKVCGFCRDIGEKWYDEDFIGYLKYEENFDLVTVLEDVPVDNDDKSMIVEIAKSAGLKEINAVYWYSGEITEPSSEKKYNGLSYIGEFNLD